MREWLTIAMTEPPPNPYPRSSVSGATASHGVWRRPLARIGVDIRSGEGGVAGLFFLYFLLLFVCFYATKAVRQSTFVDSLGAESLPFAYLLVAVCAYPALRVYGLVTEKLRHHDLITLSVLVLGAGMIGFWWLLRFSWSWVPAAFYVWATLGFGITVSQFWSYVNHAFDPRQAKRLFGFVGAGGALGGIAGGQVARVAGSSGDTGLALILVAILLGLAAALVRLIPRLYRVGEERGIEAQTDELKEVRGGFEAIYRSSYLKLIAVMMLITVMVAQVVDLQFNWGVQAYTDDLSERTAVFGTFYSLVGLGAFFFQVLFTSRIQRYLGISFAMRVLPVTMAVGTAALMIATLLGPAVLVTVAWLLKISEGGLRHSVDQVTRELLYLPVPSPLRLRAKAFIDVFVQRFAKGLAALVLLTVTFGLLSPVNAGWVSLTLIVVWIATTVGAYRLYVRAYRDGLRTGNLDLQAAIDFSDATTVEVLVQSLGSSDSRRVLHSLDLLRAHGRGGLVPPVFLRHEDAMVRQRTLVVLAEAGRRDAVPLIAATLGDSDGEVRAQAVRSLAALVAEDASEIMLPRLRSSDRRVRAAAIACLANHRNDALAGEAEAVLADLLSDGDPTVRREAARAIGQIPEPGCQEQLVQLLYDNDWMVVREAVAAVRQRVTAAGRLNPLYTPILVSLMRDRRLKHGCRDALVACGEPVIPALVHFMEDPNEHIWVRRASPKTIADIGGPAAAQALVDSLGSRDAFLRRKTIEALVALGAQGVGMEFAAQAIRRQIRSEARQYLRYLAALIAVDAEGRASVSGPLLEWKPGGGRPTLLQELLAERMHTQVQNLMGLLCLLYPELCGVERRLLCANAGARSHALEYLDHALSGEVHRHVFAVIGDSNAEEKMRQAERLFGIPLRSSAGTLRHLISSGDDFDTDPDAPALTVAALHAAYESRVHGLYALIRRTRKKSKDPFVRETAAWVVDRLRLDEPRSRLRAGSTP